MTLALHVTSERAAEARHACDACGATHVARVDARCVGWDVLWPQPRLPVGWIAVPQGHRHACTLACAGRLLRAGRSEGGGSDGR